METWFHVSSSVQWTKECPSPLIFNPSVVSIVFNTVSYFLSRNITGINEHGNSLLSLYSRYHHGAYAKSKLWPVIVFTLLPVGVDPWEIIIFHWRISPDCAFLKIVWIKVLKICSIGAFTFHTCQEGGIEHNPCHAAITHHRVICNTGNQMIRDEELHHSPSWSSRI